MIHRNTAEFRRTNLAMTAAGFATFLLMYCVQPLLPEFARDFAVSPLGASLALSLTTGCLAVALLAASAASESLGRRPMMVAAIIGAALLTILSGIKISWPELLLLRAAIGIVLAGLPAVAMAYLAEEMDRSAIGLAMGLYVGASGFGGMSGRLLTGLIADAFGWRMAMVGIGAIGLLAGLVFAAALPASRHFSPHRFEIRRLLGAYAEHLTDPGLRLLYAEAFLIMGAFVSVYNYITFRLLAPPFLLSQAEVGAIFAVYLVGVASSAIIGNLAGRFRRGALLQAAIAIELAGALLTLTATLPAIVLGIALVTFGFFAAHSTASSWVGLRARGNRAQAAALYLFLYYCGSSVVGSACGIAWARAAWGGVIAAIAALLLAALALARQLAILPSRDTEVM